jgi:parvulin-like peptidyl-prolyl isomerase
MARQADAASKPSASKSKPVKSSEEEAKKRAALEAEEEEDEFEEGDEEEDEEDEEDVEDAPRPIAASSKRPEAAEDPSWWLPHAILGTLVMVGVLGFFGLFTNLLGPTWAKVKRTPAASSSAAPSASAAAAPTPKSAAPAAPTAAPRPSAVAKPSAVDPNPTFGARRILVAYKGAKNSQATRTKEEAKARAEAAAKKLSSGAKFEEVAAEFSDDAGSKSTGGNLGRFKRDAYDASLTQTVEKLQVGGTSAVFESPFGFELVTRTE